MGAAKALVLYSTIDFCHARAYELLRAASLVLEHEQCEGLRLWRARTSVEGRDEALGARHGGPIHGHDAVIGAQAAAVGLVFADHVDDHEAGPMLPPANSQARPAVRRKLQQVTEACEGIVLMLHLGLGRRRASSAQEHIELGVGSQRADGRAAFWTLLAFGARPEQTCETKVMRARAHCGHAYAIEANATFSEFRGFGKCKVNAFRLQQRW